MGPCSTDQCIHYLGADDIAILVDHVLQLGQHQRQLLLDQLLLLLSLVSPVIGKFDIIYIIGRTGVLTAFGRHLPMHSCWYNYDLHGL